MDENLFYSHWIPEAEHERTLISNMRNQKDGVDLPYMVASHFLPEYSNDVQVTTDVLADSKLDGASDLCNPIIPMKAACGILVPCRDLDSTETEESIFSIEYGSTLLPEAQDMHMSGIMSQELTTSPVISVAEKRHTGSLVDLDTPTTSQDDCMTVSSTQEVLATGENTPLQVNPVWDACQELLELYGVDRLTSYMAKTDAQQVVNGIHIFLDWKVTKGSLARGLLACNLNPLKAKPATRIALELFFGLDSENEKDLKKFENIRNRPLQRKTEERIENEIAALLAKYKSVSMDPSAWYSIAFKVAETIIAGSVVSRGACSLWFVTPIMILQRLLQSEYGTLQAAHLEREMSNDALLRSELIPILRFECSPRRFPQAKKSGFTPYHLIKRSSAGRSPAKTTFEDDQRVLEAWKSVFGSRDLSEGGDYVHMKLLVT